MTFTRTNVNLPGSQNPLPTDVNAPTVTALTQRVGKPGDMPEALPNDVNAPAVTYHTPFSTPAGPQDGGEGGPATTYVPQMIDPTIAPAQGGNEEASTPGVVPNRLTYSSPKADPWPNDVNAPAVTPANPAVGGSNTPAWGGEGAPSTAA